MEIKQENIVFSNVKDSGIGISSKPIVFKNFGNYEHGVDLFGGIINAVDIDWNSAYMGKIPNTDNKIIINTTGDLLSYISSLGVGVSELSNILKQPIDVPTLPTTDDPTSPTTDDPTSPTTEETT